jgi:hypothetical protein
MQKNEMSPHFKGVIPFFVGKVIMTNQLILGIIYINPLHPKSSSKKSPSNVFAVGWGDGLRKFRPLHPFNSESITPVFGIAKMQVVPSASSSRVPNASKNSPLSYGLLIVLRMRWCQHCKIGFKVPVSISLESKHQAAKFDGIEKWSAANIFNYPPARCTFQSLPNWPNQIRMSLTPSTAEWTHRTVSLAWRTCPNKIEPLQRECESVGLDKMERIIALGLNINACNFKSRIMEPHGCTASLTKKVKSLGHVLPSFASEVFSASLSGDKPTRYRRLHQVPSDFSCGQLLVG